MHIHTVGGAHSTSRKTNYLSGNFSLGGTTSTGMTVSKNKKRGEKKKIVFWKISETHSKESKCDPLCGVGGRCVLLSHTCRDILQLQSQR